MRADEILEERCGAAHRREQLVSADFNGDGRQAVEGVVEGVLLDAPRGEGGFGYDPLFFYPPLGRGFAEISAEEKNRVSHRALAIARARAWLLAAS